MWADFDILINNLVINISTCYSFTSYVTLSRREQDCNIFILVVLPYSKELSRILIYNNKRLPGIAI